jgi:hypothetical protein
MNAAIAKLVYRCYQQVILHTEVQASQINSSLTSMTKTMALKKPCNALLSPEYVNTKLNQFGTSIAPKPMLSAAVKMNLFLRVKGMPAEMMRTPETATLANRNVVIPPRTGLGIDVTAAANLEKMPITISQKQLDSGQIKPELVERQYAPGITGFSVCTSSQSNDAVVLCESGHGCQGA